MTVSMNDGGTVVRMCALCKKKRLPLAIFPPLIGCQREGKGMRTGCQRNTIINDSHAVELVQGVAQLLVRVITIITEVWLRVGASAYANGLADSLAKARDTWGGLMTSIARHKLDAISTVRVLILWARQHFSTSASMARRRSKMTRVVGRLAGYSATHSIAS